MHVHEVFSAVPSSTQPLNLELPLAVELADGAHAEFDHAGDGDPLLLTIDRPVDPAALRLELHSGFHEISQDGEDRELPAVRVAGNPNIRPIDLTAALTFLTDVPFGASPAGPAELVPDTDEDIALLDEFGTRQIHMETRALLDMRTFAPAIDSDAIQALLPKTVGLRLYADAVAVNADVAKYRELWRVLESAFGLKESELVSALASYPPAQQLEFTEEELDHLKVLRGRASHAATSSGLDEILWVGDEVTQRLGRLKSLVERVILTKKTWGMRGDGVQELIPAAAWVRPDGGVVTGGGQFVVRAQFEPPVRQ